MKYCNFEMDWVDEGTTPKWDVTTDCGWEFRLTRDNKWWKLYQRTLEPCLTGELLGVKCPKCGKEVNFFQPNSETSWRILPPKNRH